MLNLTQITAIKDTFAVLIDSIRNNGGTKEHIEACFEPLRYDNALLETLDTTIINQFLERFANNDYVRKNWELLQKRNNNEKEETRWNLDKNQKQQVSNLMPSANPYILASVKNFIANLQCESITLKHLLILLREAYCGLSDIKKDPLVAPDVTEQRVWRERAYLYPFSLEKSGVKLTTDEISSLLLGFYLVNEETLEITEEKHAEAQAKLKKQSEDTEKRHTEALEKLKKQQESQLKKLKASHKKALQAKSEELQRFKQEQKVQANDDNEKQQKQRFQRRQGNVINELNPDEYYPIRFERRNSPKIHQKREKSEILSVDNVDYVDESDGELKKLKKQHQEEIKRLEEQWELEKAAALNKQNQEITQKFEDTANRIRQEAAKELQTHAASYEANGIIPYTDTYNQKMMVTLMRHYLGVYRDVKVIFNLSNTIWRETMGIPKGIRYTLEMLHKHRQGHLHLADEPNTILIPINIGKKSEPSVAPKEEAATHFFQLPGDSTFLEAFIEREIAADGNCGFKSMQATREEVTTCLLQALENNPQEVGNKLVEEIYSALLEKRFHDNTGAALVEAYHQQEKEIETVVNFQKNLIDNTKVKNLGIEGFIAWTKENKPDIHNAVNAICIKRDNAREALIQHCKETTTIKKYIELYRSHLWLGIHSALVYAEQKNINLYVWTENEKGKAPRYFHQSPNAQKTHYLHYYPREVGAHFNRLETTQTKAMAKEQTTINDDNFAHEQWLLIGIKYADRLNAVPREVLCFDPRGFSFDETIREEIKTVFPQAEISDIGHHFEYSAHSGAMVIAIASHWIGDQFTFPFRLNEPLLLALHKRTLWSLGGFLKEVPLQDKSLTEEEQRWYDSFVEAIERDDLEYFQTFLTPAPESLYYAVAQSEQQSQQWQQQHDVMLVANRLRDNQLLLVNAYLSSSETSRDLTTLNSQLVALSENINSSAHDFPLQDENDLLAFSKALGTEQIHEGKHEHQCQQNKETCDENTRERQSQIKTIENSHRAIVNFQQEGDFTQLPSHLRTLERTKLHSEIAPLKLTGNMTNEAGQNLLDITIAKRQTTIAHWLQQRGVKNDLYEQAKKAITEYDYNLIMMLWTFTPDSPYSRILERQQATILHVLKEPLAAQISLLQQQEDAITESLKSHPGELTPEQKDKLATIFSDLAESALIAILDKTNETDEKKEHLRQKRANGIPLFDDPDFTLPQRYAFCALALHDVNTAHFSRTQRQSLLEAKKQEKARLSALQKTWTENAKKLTTLTKKPMEHDVDFSLQIIELLFDNPVTTESNQQAKLTLESELPLFQCLHPDAIDEEGNTLLHHAFATSSGRMVSFLLNYSPSFKRNNQGLRPHEQKNLAGNTLLHDCVMRGEWEFLHKIFIMLLQQQHNSKDQGNEEQFIDFTLTNSIGYPLLKCTDQYGNTILHFLMDYMVKRQFGGDLPFQIELMQHLVRQGADVTALNQENQSPLDLAAQLKLSFHSGENELTLPTVILKMVGELVAREDEDASPWEKLFMEGIHIIFDEVKRAVKREEELTGKVVDKLRLMGETSLSTQKEILSKLLGDLLRAKQNNDRKEIIHLLRKGYQVKGIRPKFVIESQLNNLANKLEGEHSIIIREEANRVKALEVHQEHIVALEGQLLLSEKKLAQTAKELGDTKEENRKAQFSLARKDEENLRLGKKVEELEEQTHQAVLHNQKASAQINDMDNIIHKLQDEIRRLQKAVEETSQSSNVSLHGQSRNLIFPAVPGIEIGMNLSGPHAPSAPPLEEEETLPNKLSANTQNN